MQLVVPVAAHEAPLVAEVVIDSGHCEVVTNGELQGAEIAAGVQVVATFGLGILAIVGLRLVGIPQLGNNGVQPDAARVASRVARRPA